MAEYCMSRIPEKEGTSLTNISKQLNFLKRNGKRRNRAGHRIADVIFCYWYTIDISTGLNFEKVTCLSFFMKRIFSML